jgi:hypothetical protein
MTLKQGGVAPRGMEGNSDGQEVELQRNGDGDAFLSFLLTGCRCQEIQRKDSCRHSRVRWEFEVLPWVFAIFTMYQC